ncbi:MAG: hypothetical protein RL625_47, partial [Gemmatimonadota bacterium]
MPKTMPMTAVEIVRGELARIRRADRLRVGMLSAAWLALGLGASAFVLSAGRWIAWPALLPLL